MFKVREYATSPKRLADRLPWAILLEDGLIINKDGSLMRIACIRGHDFDSSPRMDLVARASRCNRLLNQFGSRWALFSERQHLEVTDYPLSNFTVPAAALIDEERRAMFEQSQRYFQSTDYITLVYLPPQDHTHKSLGLFFDAKRNTTNDIDWNSVLEEFKVQSGRFFNNLADNLVSMKVLVDDDALTYLHSTCSDRFHRVAMPPATIYLDSILSDADMLPGIAPKLGQHHIRIVTLRYFSETTNPLILQALDDLPFEYRFVQRFLFLDKEEAVQVFSGYARKWFQKRKSLKNHIGEVVTNRETQLPNEAASALAIDASAAQQETELGYVAQGYYTGTIIVWSKDEDTADKKIDTVIQAVTSLAMTCKHETINAVEAFMGSMPGNCYANVRKPIINTLNFSHFLPLQASWMGYIRNAHLNDVSLMVTSTSNSTPFHLSHHHGELAHLMMIGPTRAGKTFYLNSIASQFMRYPGAHVVHFDKNLGGLITCYSHDGTHYRLDNSGTVCMQPYANIDDEADRNWALEWTCDVIRAQNVVVTPAMRSNIWSALTLLAKQEPRFRTITNFLTQVMDSTVKDALADYATGGTWGSIFDGSNESFSFTHWTHFEMSDLFKIPTALDAALAYLFHRIDQLIERLNGKPLMILLDECWLFLTSRSFVAKIDDWLRTLAKANASVVFCTHNVSDVAESTIVNTILSSCPTKLYLPNHSIDELTRDHYRMMGLNERQIEIIKNATPRHDYYYTSSAGHRVFSLNPGPVQIALCGSGSKPDIALADALMKESKDNFTPRFLRAKQLDWAAELLELPQQRSLENA